MISETQRDDIIDLMNEAARLREALYEVITNGEWTNGEQCGDWKISKEVYGMACDALETDDEQQTE